MLLAHLFEAIDKRHAAFAFGRMNPPTLGHKQLADTVARASAGGDYFIFTSQTQDSKKNPLDYATKIKFLKALMPEHASHIVQDPSLRTIMQIAAWLYAKGYRSVTFVAGSDRLDNFKELLEKYNGQETANGYYQFDNINFVSSGERDPDEEGLAGVSATSAREAAKAGNLEAFAQATGAGKLAEPLYHAVRKGMLIEGLTEEDEIQSGKVWQMMYRLYSWFSKVMPDADVDIRQGGNRVWTRGDGTRYRDPARITFKDVASRDKGFELLAGALKGARKTTVSGEFGSDPYTDALIWKGKVFHKYGSFGIAIGSASRVTNKNSVWREKPVAEDASGYIPKNKKEAKDPRWSNALTVDVHPDTPTKNLKAFKLA